MLKSRSHGWAIRHDRAPGSSIKATVVFHVGTPRLPGWKPCADWCGDEATTPAFTIASVQLPTLPRTLLIIGWARLTNRCGSTLLFRINAQRSCYPVRVVEVSDQLNQVEDFLVCHVGYAEDHHVLL